MPNTPNKEFGRRRPAPPKPSVRPRPPVKRSGHVALLVMGTLAVGGGAYALMPRENCQPAAAGMAAPALPQANTECPPRGSSSGGRGYVGSGGGGSSRSSFFSGDSSSGSSSSATSDSGSSHVSRGGFGSFAHAFGFSGG